MIIRSFSVLLISLVAASHAGGQADPVFVLNPTGPSSTIFGVFANKEKGKLVTVSVDKSIGIWDSRTWTLTSRHWLDIGIGQKGKLIAADYSAEKDWLAVARINTAGEYVVNLLDLQAMTVLATYTGFSSDIGFVRFSPSSSFLVTGPWQINSGMEPFKLWKLPALPSGKGAVIDQPIDSYKTTSWIHDVCVTDAAIFFSNFDAIREVSIQYDQHAIPEYRLSKGKRVLRQFQHIAWLNESESFAAGSHNGAVSLISRGLVETRELSKGDPNVYALYGYNNLIATYSSQGGFIKVFDRAQATAIAKLETPIDNLNFYDDSTVLVTNGAKLMVFFPYRDSVYAPYGGQSNAKHIGFDDGYRISFIDDKTSFDFKELVFSKEKVDTTSLSLNKKVFYDQKLTKGVNTVLLEHSGKKEEIWHPDRVLVDFGFTNKSQVLFSLLQYHGFDPYLIISNEDGLSTHDLLSLDGMVVNFCPSKNQKENYVATLSQNGVVALWNIDNPDFRWTNDLQTERVFIGMTLRRDGGKLIADKVDTHLEKFRAGDRILRLDSLEDLSDANLLAFFRLKSAVSPVKVTFERDGKTYTRDLYLSKMREIHPLASFFSQDNEWLCWNTSGYYTASAGGEELGGWVVNKGVNDFAEFHPVYDFKKEFYRPGLVSLVVTAGSVSKGLELYNLSADVKINPGQSVSQKLPPSIEWISPKGDSALARPHARMIARQHSSTPIQATKLLLNGRTVLKREQIFVRSGAQTNEYILSLDVDLPARENVVNLFVENENGSTISDDRSITMSDASLSSDRYKPNLYIVSVGVSRHQIPNYSLTYAHADALSVGQLYQRQAGKLFNKVFEKTLTDEKATRGNILEAFYWLEQNATQKDVVIIFIASHGLNEKDKFYILPFDGDPERIRITGVDWADFAEVLGNLPSKVMVFIDACHSGKLGANLIGKRGQPDITDALRALATEENGVVIMSASTGKEPSFESATWSHGAFTLALLDGLEKGEADLNKDGVINVREIDYYIAERVKSLTSGAQHPTTQKPSVVGEFPIFHVEN